MTKAENELLRCWIVRAEDGGLYCGAHPYDTDREAMEAARVLVQDGHQKMWVVELAEVSSTLCDVKPFIAS